MADEPIDPKGTLIQRPLRVVLLAYDGMNLLDLAGPLQALNTANRSAPSGEPARYEMIVASGEGGAIVTSAGLPVVTVAVSLLADTPIDTLIAPGGCVGEEYMVAPALSKFIAQRAGTVRRLCSVCTGAFLLAAAGQLEGRRWRHTGPGSTSSSSVIPRWMSIRTASSSKTGTYGPRPA